MICSICTKPLNEAQWKNGYKSCPVARACQENCVNGYVRISRLEPVCQIVWQIDLLLKPNF